MCATRAPSVRVLWSTRDCVVLAPRSMDGCDTWLSASSQLSGAGSLLVDCGRAAGPPCVSPGFFHALRDRDRERLTMPHPWMWNHAPPCSRADLYTQCRQRRRDEAWPEEPHELRTPATKTVVDLLPLLGDRVVTVVGSSVELQLELAIQCALAGASRCSGSGSWRHWGWGTFHDDNAGCTRQKTPKEILDSGCAASGVAFEEMLAHTDIVIVGYNPQFAFRHSEELWANNLRAMLPMLERFARRPGKGKSAPPLEAPGPSQSHIRISDLSVGAVEAVALLREPAAQHFPGGGSYNASRHRSSSLDEACICEAAADASLDTNRLATEQMHTLAAQLAPSVGVLPLYNATRRRHSMHPQAMCSYRPPNQQPARRPRIASTDASSRHPPPAPPPGAAQRRPCCDCTHFCYTPAFYDATFFTPLHRILTPRSS